ncbi:uncharacterized protein PADG_00846 [Paracoccidioides brasiliensis Pb18]|uniref:Uncharacterized protein n=1 Tax=Paracoccidioides brasiliensis (strain Pb18) TaxID=502780 RepID=C1FYH0_PARBD|nr:uncharacterized protein PADG_00846 [Paracoccidioides brasiliensis Pb18]EEH44557.2 hypothetical protein PADG_00846 [Paracoccidioides brasiliensis Pb18]
MLDTTTVSMSARNFAKIPSNPSEQDRGIRLLDRRRNLMLAWNINTYNVGASHLSLRQFNVLRHCDIFDEYDASSPKKPSELWVSLRAGKYPLDDYRQHVNKVFSLGLKDNLNYAAGEKRSNRSSSHRTSGKEMAWKEFVTWAQLAERVRVVRSALLQNGFQGR